MTPARAPPEAMMAGAALVVLEVAAAPVRVGLPERVPVPEELPEEEEPESEPEEPVGAAAVSVPVLEAAWSPAAPVWEGVPSEVTK